MPAACTLPNQFRSQTTFNLRITHHTRRSSDCLQEEDVSHPLRHVHHEPAHAEVGKRQLREAFFLHHFTRTFQRGVLPQTGGNISRLRRAQRTTAKTNLVSSDEVEPLPQDLDHQTREFVRNGLALVSNDQDCVELAACRCGEHGVTAGRRTRVGPVVMESILTRCCRRGGVGPNHSTASSSLERRRWRRRLGKRSVCNGGAHELLLWLTAEAHRDAPDE